MALPASDTAATLLVRLLGAGDAAAESGALLLATARLAPSVRCVCAGVAVDAGGGEAASGVDAPERADAARAARVERRVVRAPEGVPVAPPENMGR